MIKKTNTIQKMYDTGGLAIVRTNSFERASEIAEGCIAGGMPVLEMSYTINSAGSMINRLKEKYGDSLLVGAGTVLDGETARHAILSGAEFIIAPNFSLSACKICNRYQIPYVPGCTSFSEAVVSLSEGASFIKAFPISDFYGSRLTKVFKTPLPDMPILASGGLTLDNLEVWLKNGVDVCGFGGLLTKGSTEEISENANKIHSIIKKYRKTK